MRSLIVTGTVVTLMVAGFIGCEGGGAGPSAGAKQTGGPPVAENFHPDKPALYGGQKVCPVCGGQPIKKELFVEVQGARVYFDKAECVQKFKQKYEKPLSSREVGKLRDELERAQASGE